MLNLGPPALSNSVSYAIEAGIADHQPGNVWQPGECRNNTGPQVWTNTDPADLGIAVHTRTAGNNLQGQSEIGQSITRSDPRFSRAQKATPTTSPVSFSTWQRLNRKIQSIMIAPEAPQDPRPKKRTATPSPAPAPYTVPHSDTHEP